MNIKKIFQNTWFSERVWTIASIKVYYKNYKKHYINMLNTAYKGSFWSRISLVNVTKSTVSYGFG